VLNRRKFIGRSVIAAAAADMVQSRAASAPALSYGGEFPDMALTYLANKLNAWNAKWDRERAMLTTAAKVEQRDEFVREKLRLMVHGLPAPTPLLPVVVAAHQRDGYRVENVMFQSRPNFWVTGNLYLPGGIRSPAPGIISPCGHYAWARMDPEYQFAYMNLVDAGFVVFAYDPIGQGERRQYWNPQTNETEVSASPVYEHSMPGQVLLLMGEDLTHYRIWDGMRAIDYLMTRPEVDKNRIGCAGHSGGATMTVFISALDKRVRCAAVNEAGGGHRWPIRLTPGDHVGPSDVEQNVFPAAIYGVDSYDMIAAIAPRPLLWTIENYSPSFLRTAAQVKACYGKLGASGAFATEEATDPHAWTVKLRLATTNWFLRCFYDKPAISKEPPFAAEQHATLYCTPNGSIRYSRQGETIFSLIEREGQTVTPQDVVPSQEEIARAIRYKEMRTALNVRQIVTTPRKGYQVEKLEFLSEPGIYIPAWVFVPESRNQHPATVFVHEAGKEVEGREFGLLEKLARGGYLIVAVDVRGIGQTAPPHAGGVPASEFGHLFSTDTAMTYMAWAMDECLFGMRVRDVIRSIDYAVSRGDIGHQGVRLFGKGAGAMWCLFAAALDSRVISTIAENPLISYQSLTRFDRYRHSANIFVRDVLTRFDVPQVAASIAGREVVLVAPVDPMKNRIEQNLARAEYQWTTEVYRRAGAESRFRIVNEFEMENLYESA
jgi:cephalosporin-C deacetylase-like acetyl esterase